MLFYCVLELLSRIPLGVPVNHLFLSFRLKMKLCSISGPLLASVHFKRFTNFAGRHRSIKAQLVTNEDDDKFSKILGTTSKFLVPGRLHEASSILRTWDLCTPDFLKYLSYRKDMKFRYELRGGI